MTVKTLFSPKRIGLFVFFLILVLLSLVCRPSPWESIRYLYVPNLTPGDNLDEYIHRRISIVGRFEHIPDDDQFGLVHFGDEGIEFCSPDALRSLKDGDTIRVTGDLLGLRDPREILRATVEKIQ